MVYVSLDNAYAYGAEDSRFHDSRPFNFIISSRFP